MKPAIYKVMVLAALLAIPAALYAQSGSARFNVPFAFIVNGETLPAGGYLVEVQFLNVIGFRRDDGKASLFAVASSQEQRRVTLSSKLVFRQYGDQYFLAEAQFLGTDSARAFRQGKREIQVASAYEHPAIIETAGK